MSARTIVRYSRDLSDFAAWCADREARSASAADRAAVHKLTEAAHLVSGLQIGDLSVVQTRLLLNLARVGLAATQGPKATARAARVDELREWLETTRPSVRNVAELRALPGFPKAAKLLADSTLRRRLTEAGIGTRRGGRPRKPVQKG